jgi:hypothetical protein
MVLGKKECVNHSSPTAKNLLTDRLSDGEIDSSCGLTEGAGCLPAVQ